MIQRTSNAFSSKVQSMPVDYVTTPYVVYYRGGACMFNQPVDQAQSAVHMLVHIMGFARLTLRHGW